MKAEFNDLDPRDLERFLQSMKDALPEVMMENYERGVREGLWAVGCDKYQVHSDGKNNLWVRKP